MTCSVAKSALVVAAVLTALAGCKRREEAPAAAPASATAPAAAPADVAAPLTYETKSAYAEVALRLPDAVKGQPDLHARLYSAAVTDLRQFTEGAQADRTEAGGDEGMPPYSKEVALTVAAETGKLLSLRQVSYEYTGGAHANSTYRSVLWDKSMKREASADSLFRPGADLAPLGRALCQAADQARKARSSGAAVSLSIGRAHV